jgi:hypothetical protein
VRRSAWDVTGSTSVVAEGHAGADDGRRNHLRLLVVREDGVAHSGDGDWFGPHIKMVTALSVQVR